ncbi:hypothetical protein [Flavihumibacter solisilvae]|uniref:DUF4595 domain-containing protein n=1 Tax=Flavihumibacter solisilvae TaxID=1349421 RepID=A0A0C1L0W5_9BACT|nr:hypothetical protein [Flavihumibacter solisilvae]KIC93657.1 hypothetical protein OI18_15965 [Flavihumibacter solisilvae]
MITRVLSATSVLLFFISCSKDPVNVPINPVGETPGLLMTKRIFQTTLADGQKIIDSFGYVYNDKRQLTRVTYLNLGTYFQLEYKGDLVNKATSFRSNGVKISTQVNVMIWEADGSTIRWDQSTEATNGGIDTAYVYFNFEGQQLRSIRKYLHDQVDDQPYEELVQYTYDAQGGLAYLDHQVNGKVKRHSVEKNDGRKNPYRLMTPASLMYLTGNSLYTTTLTSPLYLAGINNPLQTAADGRTETYGYSYNTQGYPLAMTIGTGYQVSYEYTEE